MTIAYIENFTSFSNLISYAVFVGIVPFDYSSDTSIHRRKESSNIANKELQQELNQTTRRAMIWGTTRNWLNLKTKLGIKTFWNNAASLKLA